MDLFLKLLSILHGHPPLFHKSKQTFFFYQLHYLYLIDRCVMFSNVAGRSQRSLQNEESMGQCLALDIKLHLFNSVHHHLDIKRASVLIFLALVKECLM